MEDELYKTNASIWPEFDLLLIQKKISYFEYSLTLFFLKNNTEVPLGVVFLLCHLILAAKRGHLCVHIDEKELIPTVDQLWLSEEGNALSKEESSSIEKLIVEARSSIPSSLITTELSEDQNHFPLHHLVKNGHFFYLQKHWVFETVFLKALKNHLAVPPKIKLNITLITEEIDRFQKEGVLQQKQAEAILQAFFHSLTIITGGPGTGKTYTAGVLIKILWTYLSDEEKKKFRCVLCAPTGKAASQLQASLARWTASLEHFPLIEAKTLHALLGLRQGNEDFINEVRRIEADFVIVDECSMIDIRMMAHLLSSLKKGSRLILLGDKDQLPSVEAGSIFCDLVHLKTSHIPCFSLNVCLRSEQKTILDFAESINRKDKERTLAHLNHASHKSSTDEGMTRLHFSGSLREKQKQFLDYVSPLFLSSSHQTIESFQKMRILSPLRKGPFGFETLNDLIFEQIQANLKGRSTIHLPIMITSNDYDCELFNGETGILVRKLPLLKHYRQEDRAFFPSKEGSSSWREFSPFSLPKYTLAYCLSVHKSQGSEFDKVILVLPEGSETFGKEVLYTAITRAKKSIEIFSSEETLEKTLQNESFRLSGITQRWTN